MDMNNLTDEAHKLSSNARRAFLEEKDCEAQLYLVELRGYLNEQPELEAGGAGTERSSKK